MTGSQHLLMLMQKSPLHRYGMSEPYSLSIPTLMLLKGIHQFLLMSIQGIAPKSDIGSAFAQESGFLVHIP